MESLVITAKAVKAAARACAVYSQGAKAVKAAEDEKKAAMMAVFEPLLGVKSEDEVAAMSPDKIKRTIKRRVAEGLITLDGIEMEALVDSIQKTQERRNVSWKDQYIGKLGESAATKVVNDTEPSYSYRFTEVG